MFVWESVVLQKSGMSDMSRDQAIANVLAACTASVGFGQAGASCYISGISFPLNDFLVY